MTDTIDNPSASEIHSSATVSAERRSGRLYRTLAWVGIAAGSLFTVATVFFSGYVLGQHDGGGGHHSGHMTLKPFPGPDGRMGPPPDGPMGPRAERLTPPSASSSTAPRP